MVTIAIITAIQLPRIAASLLLLMLSSFQNEDY
jgi:hypothetical protein